MSHQTNNGSFYNLRKSIQRKISKTIKSSNENPIKLTKENQLEIVNPYEVVRAPKKAKSPKHRPIENFVFSNPALDINCAKPTLKTIEGNFEIIRKTEKNKSSKDKGCFENPALEIPSTAIVLPFKPNVGMQIKFETPVKQPILSSIEEENILSPELHIENEIDYYENQWENSINETKIAKINKESQVITPSSLRKVRSGKITPLRQNLKKLNLRSASKMLTYSRETAV